MGRKPGGKNKAKENATKYKNSIYTKDKCRVCNSNFKFDTKTRKMSCPEHKTQKPKSNFTIKFNRKPYHCSRLNIALAILDGFETVGERVMLEKKATAFGEQKSILEWMKDSRCELKNAEMILNGLRMGKIPESLFSREKSIQAKDKEMQVKDVAKAQDHIKRIKEKEGQPKGVQPIEAGQDRKEEERRMAENPPMVTEVSLINCKCVESVSEELIPFSEKESKNVTEDYEPAGEGIFIPENKEPFEDASDKSKPVEVKVKKLATTIPTPFKEEKAVIGQYICYECNRYHFERDFNVEANICNKCFKVIKLNDTFEDTGWEVKEIKDSNGDIGHIVIDKAMEKDITEDVVKIFFDKFFISESIEEAEGAEELKQAMRKVVVDALDSLELTLNIVGSTIGCFRFAMAGLMTQVVDYVKIEQESIGTRYDTSFSGGNMIYLIGFNYI